MSEKTSLRIFIRDNYTLFAAMGIAGGLTALFTRLPEADLLVIPAFMIFLVLTLELLIATYHIKTASLSLNAFSLLCHGLLVNVFVFLIFNYQFTFLSFLFGFLPFVFGGMILGVLRKLNIKKWLVYMGLVMLAIFLGILLGYLIEVFLLQGPLP